MSNYTDGNVTINKQKIIVRDGLIPVVGVLSIKMEEVTNVEIIKLSMFMRFTLYGTNNLKTWYAFDLKRPFKSQAIKIEISESLGPFSEIVINPKNVTKAFEVIFQNCADCSVAEADE